MLAILEKLRRPANSAADLRQRLAEIEDEIPGALAAVRAADADRNAGLLNLDDRALEAVEAKLAKARRDADRLAAARGELERRLVEAEGAEAGAALERDRTAVEARAAKLAARLRADYERHAGALVGLINELAEAEAAVRDLNWKLGQAGRHADAIPGVEPRVISPGANLAELVSLTVLTSLRPLGSCPGWGAARSTAETLGLKA